MINNKINLMLGDAIEKMKELPNESVDLILTDPPYGTTNCKWDTIIPLDQMWEQLNRLIKPNGAIIIFGTEPFSSHLRMSNIKNYKYDWIWNKVQKSNFLNAKRQPLRSHELLSVFYKKQPTYNYIKSTGHPKKEVKNIPRVNNELYNDQYGESNYSSTERYPHSIITFSKDTQTSSLHPTQKPIALLEYMVNTFSNVNETVLDFTMGSGSTGVACINTNRKFIGIDNEAKTFYIAKLRMNLINNGYDDIEIYPYLKMLKEQMDKVDKHIFDENIKIDTYENYVNDLKMQLIKEGFKI